MSLSFADLSEQPKWSEKSLNGMVSFHDGPNCYNAALAAKGYIDELVYTDAIEYRYYLENFCIENTDMTTMSGDLYAFEKQGFIFHGAMSLGGDKIFEKTSTVGFRSTFREDRHDSSKYQIKDKANSKYFNGSAHEMKCPDGCIIIKSFSCLEAQNVRQSMSGLYNNLIVSELAKVRIEIQNKTRSEKLEGFSDISFKLNSLSSQIDLQVEINEEALFILVLGESIIGHLHNLNYEVSFMKHYKSGGPVKSLGSEIMTSVRKFSESLKILHKKIKDNTTDEKTLKILMVDPWD